MTSAPRANVWNCASPKDAGLTTETQRHRGVTEKKCRRRSLAGSFRRHPCAWHGDPRVWWAQPRIDAAESRSTAMLCFEKVVDARAKHKHDGAWGGFGAFVGAFFSVPSLCLCGEPLSSPNAKLCTQGGVGKW